MHNGCNPASETPQRGEKKRVTISIDSEVHELGKALAKEERRDFSSFLEVAIEERWRAAKAKEAAA